MDEEAVLGLLAAIGLVFFLLFAYLAHLTIHKDERDDAVAHIIRAIIAMAVVLACGSEFKRAKLEKRIEELEQRLLEKSQEK